MSLLTQRSMKNDSRRQAGTGVSLNGLNGNGGHEVQELPFPSEQAMDGLRGSKRCACIHERRVTPVPVCRSE